MNRVERESTFDFQCLSIDCNEHFDAIYIKHFINPTVRIFRIRSLIRFFSLHTIETQRNIIKIAVFFASLLNASCVLALDELIQFCQ